MNGFSPNRRNHLTFVILLKLYFVYLSEGHFSFLRDPFALKPEKIERGRKEVSGEGRVKGMRLAGLEK